MPEIVFNNPSYEQWVSEKGKWLVEREQLQRELSHYKRLEAILRDRADASQEPGDEGAWTMNAEMRVLTDWENGE